MSGYGVCLCSFQGTSECHMYYLFIFQTIWSALSPSCHFFYLSPWLPVALPLQLIIGFESGIVVLWDLKSKKADYRYTHDEVRHSPSICFLLEQLLVIPATSALICRAALCALEIQSQMRSCWNDNAHGDTLELRWWSVSPLWRRKRAGCVFTGNGSSNVQFGDDDSELCFARGNFYSQLLLEILNLSSSAEDERRNHSWKSFYSQTDEEQTVQSVFWRCIFISVKLTFAHHTCKKRKTSLCLKFNSPEAGICFYK